MFVSTTLCATRGRPLPNWIERSVRESRVNFMSRHQVAPNPSPFLAMSISGRARTPSCVAQVACPGGGSIPSSRIGKQGDYRMRAIGTTDWSRFRELRRCCSVGKPKCKQPNVCHDFAEKYTSVKITILP